MIDHLNDNWTGDPCDLQSVPPGQPLSQEQIDYRDTMSHDHRLANELIGEDGYVWDGKEYKLR